MDKEKGLNAEGGCAVDWSWIHGEKIASVENGLDRITIRFESGLEWTIDPPQRAGLWKGAPFLSFTPYRR